MITQSDRIGLDRLGIDNLDNICYNFSSEELVTDIVDNGNTQTKADKWRRRF